jgi:repressor LexA
LNAAYKADLSYPSSGNERIFPPFLMVVKGRIIPAVPEQLDITTIRENLKRIMKRKDVRPTTLSQQVGESKTLVKDLLTKTNDVRVGTLIRLATALEVDLDELLARPRVPIAGRIGAGGSIAWMDIGEEIDPDLTVPRPPGVTGKLVALMVDGSSMLPKYKAGDIIYIQRNHEGVLEEYVGEDCAVRLSTGETYIKQLTLGSVEGRFTLRSLNAPDIENVEVEWATPVLFIMPAKSRKIFGG